MVLFNYSTKELTAKIVYYGPGLCGKTTNLQWIHEKLPIKNKGKMLSLATETDRTLFFDFLPIELGSIRGMKTRVQLYTVPGQVFYNATRRMVLKGADCVVFVVDSQEPILEANLESWENMRQNLEANEIDPGEIPVVFQYNKRDLPNALPIEILNERLNPAERPFHEAVAVRGVGVDECLRTATALVFRSLAGKYGAGAEAASSPVTPIPPPAVLAAAPAPASVAAAAPPPPPPPREPAPRVASATIPPGEELSFRLEPEPPPPRVLEEEFALEEEELVPGPPDAPAPAPAPARPAASAGGRDTIASPPREAEEIRRHIRRPSSFEPAITFEAIDDDDDEIEELTLEAVSSEASTEPSRGSREADDRRMARRPEPAPALPPPLPVAAVTAPVSLITSSAQEADVEVPVLVTIRGDTAQVQVNLRIKLQIRLDK